MKYFIPFLKTKRSTEKTICKFIVECGCSAIIPYLELVHGIDHPEVPRYRAILGDAMHFEEVFRKSKISLLEAATGAKDLLNQPQVIPSVHITSTDSPNDFRHVIDFLDSAHGQGKNACIRFDPLEDPDSIQQVIDNMGEGDYLVFDIRSNSLLSAAFPYVDMFNSLPNGVALIVTSQERNTKLSGKAYAVDGDSTVLFNNTLIDQISICGIDFAGFGSTCTLKDDLMSEDQTPTEAYGLLVLYDSKTNGFYTRRTEDKHQIALAYKLLEQTIKASPSQEVSMLSKTPVSNSLFSSLNPSAIKYQKVAAIHYIEEVLNKYFS